MYRHMPHAAASDALCVADRADVRHRLRRHIGAVEIRFAFNCSFYSVKIKVRFNVPSDTYKVISGDDWRIVYIT